MFTPLRRLLCLTTAIALVAPNLALAQTTTPPARVGQVANVSGSVSYNGAGSNGQWVAATSNYPLTSGDSLFTQANAEATIEVDSSAFTLGPNTEVQITDLDDTTFTATQSQGEVFLSLTDLQPGQNYTLNTPRGPVSITENGQYDINAGDANDPTTIAVLSGAATAGSLQIPAGQEGYLSGTDQTTAQLGAIQKDDFLDTVLQQMAPPPPPYAPPVVSQMTGAAELSQYGSWDDTPQYGAVWYPQVDPDWAPYREGHWAFVAPWGWTWVDVEPWGFAPFHYGRWIHDDDRWGWVPAGAYDQGGYGPSYQPVYAPAVVGFFGLAAGAVITAALLNHGNVGWVPLGPGEAFHPYYHADPGYIRQINRVDVRNDQQINNTTVINNYANRGAATYIPGDAMARGASVRQYGHPMTPEMFSQAHAVAPASFNQSLRPAYTPRAAEPPHLTSFAERMSMPPQVISHAATPFQGAGSMSHMNMLAPEANTMRPAAPPSYHPEQVQQGYHPTMTPQYNAPSYHPAIPQYHAPAAPAYHPEMPQVYQPHEAAPPAYHPQMPQVYQPQREAAPAYHPPVQPFQPPAYHPPVQEYRPPVQQFAPQFHPQPAPQFHPQEVPHFAPPQEKRPQ